MLEPDARKASPVILGGITSYVFSFLGGILRLIIIKITPRFMIAVVIVWFFPTDHRQRINFINAHHAYYTSRVFLSFLELASRNTACPTAVCMCEGRGVTPDQ